MFYVGGYIYLLEVVWPNGTIKDFLLKQPRFDMIVLLDVLPSWFHIYSWNKNWFAQLHIDVVTSRTVNLFGSQSEAYKTFRRCMDRPLARLDARSGSNLYHEPCE